MRERLRTDYGWTERQRQVLDLMARGKTNTEIAEALGVSLAGAKWHVSEILSKLQAESREEAAEYWRRYNGLAPRFGRVFRGIAGWSGMKWAFAGATALCAVAVFVTVVLIGMLTTEDALEQSAGDEGTGTQPPADRIKDVRQISLDEVRAVWLSMVNHPFRSTEPRPLDAADADDLETIEQLLTWLQAAEPSGLPVDATPTGPPFLHLLVLLEDGTIVNASEAWDCTSSENSTSCVLAGPHVDVSLGGGAATRMLAPELAAWFNNPERELVEMIPLEEAYAAWAALTGAAGRKP
jgi:DNA-binding CsgD family transcriptional regulator